MKVVLSLLAALASVIPGVVLAFKWGPSVMGSICPSANGPNLCVLFGTLGLMAVVPLILSVIVGIVVWKVLSVAGKKS